MLSIHPQYIKDSNGNNTYVILPAKEFHTIMEDLEELDDIKLYDQSKQDGSPFIPIDEAFKAIEANRKNKQ